MNEKKKVILILFSSLLFILLLRFFAIQDISGGATASQQGEVSICIVRLPQVTNIADQSVIIGNSLTLQVEATFFGSNTNIAYYDDTSLFDINSSNGLISFTPTSSNVGTHTITIIVEDASDCRAMNVTEPFTLTVSEPTVPPPSGGGGGGGGGAAAKKAPYLSFVLGEEIVKIVLKESQKMDKQVILKNNGEDDLVFEISSFSPGVVDVFPSKFSLPAGEQKVLTLLFNQYNDAKPNIYSGLLTFLATATDSRTVTKFLTSVVEIESEEILFDASLDLAKKNFLPGEAISAAVTIFNLRKIVPAEVKLIYSLMDLNNNIIYEEEETLSLDEQASFTKSISFPQGINPGKYVLAIKLLSDESFATVTELLTIEEPTPRPTPLAGMAAEVSKTPVFVFAVPLMLVLIVAIMVFFYFHHKKVKERRPIIKTQKTIVKQKTIIKPRTIIRDDVARLKRKLVLLKESYKQGYIQEKNYREARDKLNSLIKHN